MFKLAKSVLLAVSTTDPELFRKEYFKLIKWMAPHEVKTLTVWCMQTFDMDLLALIGIS